MQEEILLCTIRRELHKGEIYPIINIAALVYGYTFGICHNVRLFCYIFFTFQPPIDYIEISFGLTRKASLN
jgi:hypothetical protein